MHAVLFLVAVLLGVLSGSTDYWQNMVWAAVLYGPILLVTVLLHELGHCLASRWVSCCRLLLLHMHRQHQSEQQVPAFRWALMCTAFCCGRWGAWHL